MSKLETPMIEGYWSRIGGTLVLEFQAVPRTATTGRRLIDAVILPGRPTTKTHWSKVDLQGQDVLAIQAKASRLGMYLMGQAIFSAALLRDRFKPRAVRSIILCSKDDAVLRPYLVAYPEVEVVVDEVAPVKVSEEEAG
jgi:hypothetical protein